MKITDKGNTKIISIESSTIEEMINSIESNYTKSYVMRNLVIDLSNSEEDLDEDIFEELAIKHMEEANKSFVIVAPDVDFNAFDGDLIVVPTLQEAFDLIEMDEIQRDLEF